MTKLVRWIPQNSWWDLHW